MRHHCDRAPKEALQTAPPAGAKGDITTQASSSAGFAYIFDFTAPCFPMVIASSTAFAPEAP